MKGLIHKFLKYGIIDANIIMITANGQDGIVKDALKLGAKGFILKPISEEKLENSIGMIFPEYSHSYSNLLDENDLDNSF